MNDSLETKSIIKEKTVVDYLRSIFARIAKIEEIDTDLIIKQYKSKFGNMIRPKDLLIDGLELNEEFICYFPLRLSIYTNLVKIFSTNTTSAEIYNSLDKIFEYYGNEDLLEINNALLDSIVSDYFIQEHRVKDSVLSLIKDSYFEVFQNPSSAKNLNSIISFFENQLLNLNNIIFQESLGKGELLFKMIVNELDKDKTDNIFKDSIKVLNSIVKLMNQTNLSPLEVKSIDSFINKTLESSESKATLFNLHFFTKELLELPLEEKKLIFSKMLNEEFNSLKITLNFIQGSPNIFNFFKTNCFKGKSFDELNECLFSFLSKQKMNSQEMGELFGRLTKENLVKLTNLSAKLDIENLQINPNLYIEFVSFVSSFDTKIDYDTMFKELDEKKLFELKNSVSLERDLLPYDSNSQTISDYLKSFLVKKHTQDKEDRELNKRKKIVSYLDPYLQMHGLGLDIDNLSNNAFDAINKHFAVYKANGHYDFSSFDSKPIFEKYLLILGSYTSKKMKRFINENIKI